MDVFGIFIVVSFMCIIITLVVMTIVKKSNKSQEYKPYSKYYVAEKSKDLELSSRVLSDKPKSEVVTKQKQPTQTVKTRLEVNPDRNVSRGVSKSSNNTNSSYDTSLANPLNPKNVLLYASLLDDSSNNSSSYNCYNSCNNSSSSSYSDSSSSYSSSSSTDSSSSSCSSDSSSW